MEQTYEEFIQNILDTRGRFACGNEYHERHHIMPKCLGGGNENENLIDLFAREHFIAHKLLVQENPDNDSLVYAYGCMTWANNKNQERYEISPEEYENAKRSLSAVMKGKPKSDETRAKLSAIKAGKPLSIETKEKLSKSLKGRVFSDEHKENISNALKGRVFSDEHKSNISKAKSGRILSDAEKAALIIVGEMNRGRKHSEESKSKISAGNKGKVMSQESREKMSQAKKGKKPATMIRVAQYDLYTGDFIKEFESIMAASREIGIDNSYLAKCIKNNKPAGGFNWKII